ncbi:MAG: diaminopimelate epimerase [Marivivens sp.]|nr:diaminopimelate epimerase [Marivivens sp.]
MIYEADGNTFAIHDYTRDNKEPLQRFDEGVDGYIELYASKQADYKMIIVNKDMTTAEMCGNAIRCIIKYLRENNINTNKKINIETAAGIIRTKLVSGKLHISMVAATLYSPILVHGYHVTPISVGNPHAVVYVTSLSLVSQQIAEQIKLCKNGLGELFFPDGVNLEFGCVQDDGIHVRVFERGVGETTSCGTGACAVALVSYFYNLCGDNVKIKMKGGDIDVKVKNNVATMITNLI